MLRKTVTVLLLASMALAFHSSTLATVRADDGAMLVTLDVCSDDMTAGAIVSPTVPAPIFSFVFNRTYETISCEKCLLFSLQYPAVPHRPPPV